MKINERIDQIHDIYQLAQFMIEEDSISDIDKVKDVAEKEYKSKFDDCVIDSIIDTFTKCIIVENTKTDIGIFADIRYINDMNDLLVLCTIMKSLGKENYPKRFLEFVSNVEPTKTHIRNVA